MRVIIDHPDTLKYCGRIPFTLIIKIILFTETFVYEKFKAVLMAADGKIVSK